MTKETFLIICKSYQDLIQLSDKLKNNLQIATTNNSNILTKIANQLLKTTIEEEFPSFPSILQVDIIEYIDAIANGGGVDFENRTIWYDKQNAVAYCSSDFEDVWDYCCKMLIEFN